jgi:hypothetical protein
MTMTRRRLAPVRRLVLATDPRSMGPGAVVVRQGDSTLLVEGTSLEAGQANREKMVRTRRAKHLFRAAAMPLILGLAVAGGRAIGQMGQETRAVRTIAPTRQPVNRQVNTASLLPLALIPGTPTTH